MIYSQLNVRPTVETLTYLSEAMSGAPIDIDLSSFKVEVITTRDEVIPCPDNMYNATAINLKVWYDAYLQRSSLILSLESSDLQKRYLQLTQQGVVREWYSYYNPHLTLCKNAPESHRGRTFIYQTANVLCTAERPLQFTGEYLVNVDRPPPLDSENNEVM